MPEAPTPTPLGLEVPARLGLSVPGAWDRARVYALPALAVGAIGLLRLIGGDYKVDSALYAGVAWHMIQEGTWWTPMAGDDPYFNKPPLVLWIHAAFMGVLGPELWVVRLPQVLAAMGAAALTAHLARLLSGPRVGVFAGLMLALSFPFFSYLNRFVMDYWVVAFMLAGVAMATTGIVHGRALAILLSGVPIGLSMMCKPFFALLALPIVGVWLLLSSDRRRVARSAGCAALLGAMALAAAVAAPWHVSMYLTHGDAFLDPYIRREVAGRVGDGEFVRDPVWSYLWFVVRSFHPWQIPMWLGLGWLIVHCVRSRRVPLRSAAGISLCLVWTLAWLALLSSFGDKRIRYMMHVWPALAWLASIWLVQWSPRSMRNGHTRNLDVLLAVLVLASVVVAGAGWLRGDPAREDWVSFQHESVRLASDRGVPLWEGLLHPPRTGEVYLCTGNWPLTMYPANGLGFREPPPGALVMWQRDRLHEFARPAIVAECHNIVLVRWEERLAERVRRP